jgi:hypothetical protein
MSTQDASVTTRVPKSRKRAAPSSDGATSKRRKKQKRNPTVAEFPLSSAPLSSETNASSRLTIREYIDERALTFMTHRSNPMSLDEAVQTRLLAMKARLQRDDQHRAFVWTQYARAKRNEYCIGRVYAQSCSLQSLDRRTRGMLGSRIYRDIDMSNAQPTITLQYAQRRNWPRACLAQYVSMRESKLGELCARYVHLSRADAKNVYLMLLNGGGDTAIREKHNLTSELPAFCAQIRAEAREHLRLFGSTVDVNDPQHTAIREEHNARQTSGKTADLSRMLFANTIQNEEHLILCAMREYWEANGYRVGALIFDGLLVCHGAPLPATDVDACRAHVAEKTGYEVCLTDSPLEAAESVRELDDWLFGNFRLLTQQLCSIAMVDDYIRSTVAFMDNGGNVACMTRNVDAGHVRWEPLHNSIRDVYKKNVSPFCVTSSSPVGGGVHAYDDDDDDNDGENAKKSSKYVVLAERVQHLQQMGKMKTYDWVVFEPYLRPGTEVQNRCFNLFTGFKFEAPSPAQPRAWTADDVAQDTNKAIKHIYAVLANGNAENALYILKYIAHMVQQPADNPGVCLLFQSTMQGTGKNMFWEWIGKQVLGEKYFALSESLDVVTKQFNKGQEHLLLHVMDEIANYGGSFKSNDQLKTMITRSRITIEPKHREAYTVNHFARYIMLTNNTWAVKIENGDRRYCIFPVSNHRACDHEYFSELMKWMSSEEHQCSFFHLVANIDLSGFHPRQGTKSSSLKLHMQFSNRDALPIRHLISLVRHLAETKTISLESDTLFGKYGEWLRERSEFHNVSKREWQTILKSKWNTKTAKETNKETKKQKRRYVIDKRSLLARIRTIINHPTFEFADVGGDE